MTTMNNINSTMPIVIRTNPPYVRGVHGATDHIKRIGYYNLGCVLSEGLCSITRRGVHIITNAAVAVKISDKSIMHKVYWNNKLNEVDIISRLRHPNIIRLLQITETNTIHFMISEYFECNTIAEILADTGKMEDMKACNAFHQIVQAVYYCHSKNIAHGSIEAENVLINKLGNIKLTGFQNSRFNNRKERTKFWNGNQQYTPPEIFGVQEYDMMIADIWCLGILLFVMLRGTYPFDGNTITDLRLNVVLGKFPPTATVGGCLISLLLTQSVRFRPSAAQVKNHLWFQKYRSHNEFVKVDTDKILQNENPVHLLFNSAIN